MRTNPLPLPTLPSVSPPSLSSPLLPISSRVQTDSLARALSLSLSLFCARFLSPCLSLSLSLCSSLPLNVCLAPLQPTLAAANYPFPCFLLWGESLVPMRDAPFLVALTCRPCTPICRTRGPPSAYPPKSPRVLRDSPTWRIVRHAVFEDRKRIIR